MLTSYDDDHDNDDDEEEYKGNEEERMTFMLFLGVSALLVCAIALERESESERRSVSDNELNQKGKLGENRSLIHGIVILKGKKKRKTRESKQRM